MERADECTRLAEQADRLIDPDWFVRPNGASAALGIHGIGHTRRVYVLSSLIAEAVALGAFERQALELAALWHDIGRTNDGTDDYHGAKSAGKVVGLGLHDGLAHGVVDAALFAVTHHSGSEALAEREVAKTLDPAQTLRIFRVLKDADGLDRVRLGDLDPSYLRHPESVELVLLAQQLLARG